VIGIGFHKTGTTSLSSALSILGFNNLRGIQLLRKTWGDKKCFQYLNDKHYAPYLEILKTYDSVQDNPWYLLYKEIDSQYPDSKFILTIRNESEWLESCNRFFGAKRKPIHKFIYGVDTFLGNEDIYLKRYQKHNREVLTHFSDMKEKLLVLDLSKGNAWKKICTFLNKPIIDLPFPHLNKNGKLEILK